MAFAANLGFPRIGADRELKKAVEGFWKGNVNKHTLLDTAAKLKARHWKLQNDAGIEAIPSNDFSLYDQVLDTIALLGAVPERYNFSGDNVDLDTYFAMARGAQTGGKDVTAMEMTKWFDTNYHYIVPELSKGTKFKVSSTKIVDEFKEAWKQGIKTRPVLLGPVSFLLVGKMKDGADPLALLDKLVPVYVEILENLASEGAEWVQIDEPCLALDLSDEVREAYKSAYEKIAEVDVKIMLTTYFEGLRENLETAANLPTAGLHVDLVRAPKQLDEVLDALPAEKILSMGVIDGRNIWAADLDKALEKVEKAVNRLGAERVAIAPSCSLLHSPVDLDNESALDDEIKSWLAFATQKLSEIAAVAKGANEGRDAIKAELKASEAVQKTRATSKRIHNEAVKTRAGNIEDKLLNRKSVFADRAKIQHERLNLPLLPTTTIGSFPQTQEVRQARAKFKKSELTREQYDAFLEEQTKRCITIQEEIGLDVLVHGEFERNDMVEYFGEKLSGFAFTKNGWVQSYGSRCVKPPIIFGDVSRPEPMTVRWAKFSQENTDKIMKGMLTGPVTILQWSFVRDDQPREATCKQIAFAVRDEVVDLEKAGIKVIQIDEAALREGLPLRTADWNSYLKWAVDSFRITASGVEDETQIHTHMCYSEFNDIIGAVADMDADVISIETSRSQMELLDAFVDFKYPNEIGPGVYDIHSPRVPSEQEIKGLLEKALKVLSPSQVWVNPDCGLKTRGWPEVEEALRIMVEATKEARAKLGDEGKRASA
jgi:5-methyltetrahydropteroyltriglutamate--homocysteine methyltransferase